MMAVILPPRTAHKPPEELRDLTIEHELLDRVDGSARFSFGDIKALASVSGPIEVRLANESASKATFEVLIRPLTSIPGTESRSLAATIRSLLIPSLLLAQNPRTLIQLVIQCLSSSSLQSTVSTNTTTNEVFSLGIVAAMINASTLALLSSAVPMRGVVCAVSVARYLPPWSTEGHLVLDPSEDQVRSSTASGCFAFLIASKSTNSSEDPDATEVWSNWQSMISFDEQELLEARRLAKTGAKMVWMKMKETLALMASPSFVVDEESKDDEEKMEI